MEIPGNRGLSQLPGEKSVATVLSPTSIDAGIWRERALFLLNFIKNPFRNASVIPSSQSACQSILSDLHWDNIHTVVELGPGSGTFTKEIISRCRPGTHIVLIELEESYVHLLESKYGSRIEVVHDSALRMNEILDELNLYQADLIVSSLPFLNKNIMQKIFAAILQQTGKGATFRFFTYMPPVMKWFYKGMPLRKIKFVMQNIPPMWIYGIN